MRKLAIVSVIALFSSLTFAGIPYEELDADKDGVISAEEAQADPKLAGRFKDLDKNQDDRLDAAEFAQFKMTPASVRQEGAEAGR